MAAGEEAAHTVSDNIVTEFATYEDFLDSQITPTDLYYLEVRHERRSRSEEPVVLHSPRQYKF